MRRAVGGFAPAWTWRARQQQGSEAEAEADCGVLHLLGSGWKGARGARGRGARRAVLGKREEGRGGVGPPPRGVAYTKHHRPLW